MNATVKSFLGEWYIWWVTGSDPVLQRGWKVLIGTGQEGAREPFLSPEYDICIGFSVFEPAADGTWVEVLSTTDQDSKPLALVLTGETLRWSGTFQGQALRIYISLSQAVTSDEVVAVSLYGSTLRGDPDQVAVWGANDSPPP